MVPINKRKVLLTLLFALYSISNIFVHLKTSFTYQVKQINYLYELLDQTNNNYDILYQKYALLNKKYDGLNEEIKKINYKLDALKKKSDDDNATCQELIEEEKTTCQELIEETTNNIKVIDQYFIEKICLDYEKVDNDMSPLKHSMNDMFLKTNPNNTIVKMFYTFF